MTEIDLHFRCTHYRLSGNAPVGGEAARGAAMELKAGAPPVAVLCPDAGCQCHPHQGLPLSHIQSVHLRKGKALKTRFPLSDFGARGVLLGIYSMAVSASV